MEDLNPASYLRLSTPDVHMILNPKVHFHLGYKGIVAPESTTLLLSQSSANNQQANLTDLGERLHY